MKDDDNLLTKDSLEELQISDSYEEEKFDEYDINTIKPCSIFLVLNNFLIEDAMVLPITKDLVIGKGKDQFFIFTSFDQKFDEFKQSHIKMFDLSNMPEKYFFRYDCYNLTDLEPEYPYEKDIFTMPKNELIHHIQTIYMSSMMDEPNYLKSFKEVYSDYEYQKIQVTDFKDYHQNKYNYTVYAISKYRNIPEITEKQIKHFWENQLYFITEAFKNEIKEFKNTQYYKIHNIQEGKNLCDYQTILPIDILVAYNQNDTNKGENLINLYNIQTGDNLNIDITLPAPLIIKQLERLLFYIQSQELRTLKLPEKLLQQIRSIIRNNKFEEYGKKLANLIYDYLRYSNDLIDKNNLNRELCQHLLTNIIFGNIDILELNQTALNNKEKDYFFNYITSNLCLLNLDFGINSEALVLKLKNLHEQLNKENISNSHIKIDFLPYSVFTKDYHEECMKISCYNSILKFHYSNDRISYSPNLNKTKSFVDNKPVVRQNISYPYFRIKLNVDVDYAALDDSIIAKFINHYIKQLHKKIEALIFFEEKGMNTEINIYCSNTEPERMLFTPLSYFDLEKKLIETAKKYFIPLLPLKNEKNEIKNNLNKFLEESKLPESKQKSTKLSR